MLQLGFPGGPVIDRLAREGDPEAIAFPRGLTGPRDAAYDFSFSGLKTAVARWIEAKRAAGEEIPVRDVAASFQEAVVDVLTRKAVRACKDEGVDHLMIGGGVAANSRLRALAESAHLDPAFAEKLLNFIVAEVIRHHERIADEVVTGEGADTAGVSQAAG